MRTTLDLPDPLFRELKSRAAQEGRKLKELVTGYIEAGLHSPQVSTPTSGRPFRSPLPVVRRATQNPVPAMSNKQVQNTLDDEDAQRAR